MIKSLLTIIVVGGISFYYTDIESPSLLLSIFLPIINFLALLTLGFWFVTLFHKIGINQTSSSGGGDGTGFFGGGDGGDDGGGC